VAPKDRDIAMVFQNYALYPHMNVRQNIGFALHQRSPGAKGSDPFRPSWGLNLQRRRQGV
jgi:ABC-type sugar transport system ATPase subunit